MTEDGEFVQLTVTEGVGYMTGLVRDFMDIMQRDRHSEIICEIATMQDDPKAVLLLSLNGGKRLKLTEASGAAFCEAIDYAITQVGDRTGLKALADGVRKMLEALHKHNAERRPY